MNIRSMSFLAALLAVPAMVQAQAATNDHLKCYQVKDALNLAAVVDLDSPQFGLESGCKVGKAKYFCIPAEKTVTFAEDKKTHSPILPLPIGGPDAGDRICYKVKCPVSVIPDQPVIDQFGIRTLTKFKASLLCTPAVKGNRFVDNGDGTVTDQYTGLQWEQKTGTPGTPISCPSPASCPNPHEVRNAYGWTNSGTVPDGGIFTDFLARLNDCTSSDGTSIAGGFAGHCDWRLPSVTELQTILLAPNPCGTAPCIDSVFGPTNSYLYWSSTTSSSDATKAWQVTFSVGALGTVAKTSLSQHVRAVRGGW